MDATARHQCMIYAGSPAKHLRGVAHVMVEKLRANNRCLYLNSPTMVAGIRSYLAAAGLDVAQQVIKGALVLSSDQNHLVSGRFDVDRMLSMLGSALNDAVADGYAGLWASGDMTWELGNQQNFEMLMEYECELEKLFRSHPALSGICQYHQDTLPDDSLHVALSRHRAVYINETLSRVNPIYSPIESPAAKRLSTPRLKEMLSHLHLQAES
jgi:MEDS: MEthanogen/methylotroph, DcmR Sensory domain